MVTRSVADGKFEWEGENRVALFVRDDEGPTVRFMPIKDPLAHGLASDLRSLNPYRFQVLKLDTFLIEHCRGFVFDVARQTALIGGSGRKVRDRIEHFLRAAIDND